MSGSLTEAGPAARIEEDEPAAPHKRWFGPSRLPCAFPTSRCAFPSGVISRRPRGHHTPVRAPSRWPALRWGRRLLRGQPWQVAKSFVRLCRRRSVRMRTCVHHTGARQVRHRGSPAFPSAFTPASCELGHSGAEPDEDILGEALRHTRHTRDSEREASHPSRDQGRENGERRVRLTTMCRPSREGRGSGGKVVARSAALGKAGVVAGCESLRPLGLRGLLVTKRRFK